MLLSEAREDGGARGVGSGVPASVGAVWAHSGFTGVPEPGGADGDEVRDRDPVRAGDKGTEQS